MLTGTLRAPRKMKRGDDKSSFVSGVPSLDTWFERYAWQNQRANNAIVYVSALTAEDSSQEDVVLGYYALCSAGVSQGDAPEEFARHRPNTIPVILLARLAVDKRAQGRGVGAALLRDAIARAVTASEAIGAAGLLIHCLDESARDFYLHLVDLLPSPTDPLHLVLPIKGAHAFLQSK